LLGARRGRIREEKKRDVEESEGTRTKGRVQQENGLSASRKKA